MNFKCKCGNDKFFSGKHHNIIMCAKCKTVYKDREEIKLDYFGSAKTIKTPRIYTSELANYEMEG